MNEVRRCLGMLDARGHRDLAVLSVLMMLNSVFEVISIGVILPFIALISAPSLVTDNALIRPFYEAAGAPPVNTFLIMIGGGILIFILFKNAYLYWITKWQSRFTYRNAARIAVLLVGRYLHAPYETHVHRNTADFTSTAEYTVDVLFTQVMLSFLTAATESSVLAGIVVLMLIAEPMATLLLMGVAGVCAGALIVLLRKDLTLLGEKVLRLRADRLNLVQQALSGIKDVIVLGREGFFLDRYATLRERHAEAQAQVNLLTQAPRFVLEGVVVGGLMLVVLVVLVQGRATQDIIAVLGLFAMAAFRIMPGLNRIVSAINAIRNGRAAVAEVVRDLADPMLAPARTLANETPVPFMLEIELVDVAFRYRSVTRQALQSVSLRIGRGESVGLVGPSGAGKSTLVDVLLGLLVPQSGEMRVDGVDIRNRIRGWRKTIGYVPQTISMLDDTLRNNVAFGVPPEQIDDARVWKVLEMAHLDAFCNALPDGLDSMVGERGMRISGGQRQRVGIARALYHDPAILVFDEATAALDNESEREITRAIETLHRSKTIIIIAHRLSTVRRCDRLYVMKEGAVIASGTFDALVKSCADFRRMVKLAELSSETAEMDLPLR